MPSPPSGLRPAAVSLLLLLALALAGCGSGGHASAGGSGQGGGRSTRSSPATTSSATSTASTSTVLPGTGRPSVTIGDKNYTEQFVLGELYKQALEAQGYKVTVDENIGPPAVVRQALASGSLAMYPEYLDVFDQTLAGYRRGFHSRRSALLAARTWAARHRLRLLDPTPFSDTDAIAVTDAYAAAHRLRTLRGLAHVPGGFALGGAVQFRTQRPGLPALSAVYRVTPRAFRPIAVGSQYDELDSDQIQAAYVNTTDGELASGDYRVLGDPRGIFGYGNVVPVLTESSEVREGPAFAATIERVDRTLTLTAMRSLNDAAQANGASPAAVAMQYLQTHGLLTPLPASLS